MNSADFLSIRNRILLCFCLINFCTGALYVWSILAGPLAGKLSAASGTALTAADLGPVFGLASGLTPVLMLAGGIINDRFGPKWVIGLGGLALSAGYFIAAVSASMSMLYVAYGVLVGAGTGLVNGCTISTAVKCFPDRRGFAGGLVTASLGIGAALLPFVVQALIDTFGIDSTLFALAAFSAVVILPLSTFTRAAPSSFEKEFKAVHDGKAVETTPSKDWRGMIASPTFLPLALLFMTSATLGLMLLSNASGIAQTQIGLTAAGAAAAVSVISIANTAGRFVSGVVSDLIGRIPTLAAALVIAFAGLLLLANASTGDALLFFVGLAAIGTCFGAFIGIYPSLVADEYGPAHNSVNFSILMLGYSAGGLSGPMLVLAAGANGSLTRMYLLAAAACVFGLVCAGIYRLIKRRTR